MFRKNTSVIEDISFAPRRSAISDSFKSAFRLSRAAYVVLIFKTCERFAFYGTQSILRYFFKNRLGLSQNESYLVYHLFLAVYYLFPLFGAIVSDNYLGSFKTVVIASGLSLVGYSVATGMAFFSDGNIVGSLLSLFTIAIFTGAYNPCLLAFGGDQVSSKNTKTYDTFFSCLYILTNIASVLALYVAPFLHTKIYCFGTECYLLSFGLMTSVLLIAYIVFVACKPIYEVRFVKSNVITEFVKCIRHAVTRWSRERKTLKKTELLDYATDKFPIDFVRDSKTVVSLFIIFSPIPLFWAIYFQQGSLWTEQAQQLNGYITSKAAILPEQMALCNPVMICILVPLFEFAIFPSAKRFGILQTRTTRMIVGYVLAILAFLYSGFLQIAIEDNFNTIIKSPKCQVHVANLAPFGINLNSTIPELSKYLDSMKYDTVITKGKDPIFINANYKLLDDQDINNKFEVKPRMGGSVSLFLISGLNDTLIAFQNYSKPDIKGSHSKFRLLIGFEPPSNSTFFIFTANGTRINLFTPKSALDRLSSYFQLPHGNYSLFLDANNSSNSTFLGKIKSKNPWVSTIGIVRTEDSFEFLVIEEFRVSLYSIWLQIPMYFLISCSEILLYITLMAFAYNEAPNSMKALMQAILHLTSFFGNMIAVLVRLSIKHKDSVVLEIFILCGLGILGCAVYSVLCVRYNRAKVKQSKYGEFLDDFVRYQMSDMRTADAT